MFFLILLLSLIFTKPIFAVPIVSISDYSSGSDPEWVELINNTDSNITVEGWTIKDSNGIDSDDLTLTGCISPHSYQTFYHN